MKLWAVSLRQSLVGVPEPRIFLYGETSEDAKNQARELLDDSAPLAPPCEISRVECITEQTMRSEFSREPKKETEA